MVRLDCPDSGVGLWAVRRAGSHDADPEIKSYGNTYATFNTNTNGYT